MKNSIVITSILLTVLIFTACQKDKKDAVTKKVSEPTIHVHQPMDGMTYNAGDTVPVKVHFMDDDELHEYEIIVTNTTRNMELLKLDGHEHGTSYEVDTFVVVTAAMHSDYVMMTKVSNHNGAEARDTTEFHVHP